MTNKHLKIYLALLVLLLMFMPTQVFAINIGDSISNSINIFSDEEEEPAEDDQTAEEPTDVEEAPVEEPPAPSEDVQGPSSIGPGQQIMDPTIEQNFVNQQNIVVMEEGYQITSTKWLPDSIEVETLDNGEVAPTESQYNGYQDYGFISDLADQWLTEETAAMNASAYEYQEYEMPSVSSYSLEDLEEEDVMNVVYYFSGPQKLSQNELAIIATICDALMYYYVDEGYTSTILMINEILQGSYTHSAEQQDTYAKELEYLANRGSFYIYGTIVYEDVFYSFHTGLEIFRQSPTGNVVYGSKGDPTAQQTFIPGAAPLNVCSDNKTDTTYNVYVIWNNLPFIHYNGDDYGYKKLIAPSSAFPGGSFSEHEDSNPDEEWYETASCGYWAVDLTYSTSGYNSKNNGDVILVEDDNKDNDDSNNNTNININGTYTSATTGEKAMIDAIVYASGIFLSNTSNQDAMDLRSVAATSMIHQMMRVTNVDYSTGGSASASDWDALENATIAAWDNDDESTIDDYVRYVSNMADDYYNNVNDNGGWKSTECIYDNTSTSGKGSHYDVTARVTNFYQTYQKYPSIDVIDVKVDDINKSGGTDGKADIDEELLVTVRLANYSKVSATVNLDATLESGEFNGGPYGFTEINGPDSDPAYGDCGSATDDSCVLKGDSRSNPHKPPEIYEYTDSDGVVHHTGHEYEFTFKIKTSANPDSNWNYDDSVKYTFGISSASGSYTTNDMLKYDETTKSVTVPKAPNKAPTFSKKPNIEAPANAPSDPAINSGMEVIDPEEGAKSFNSTATSSINGYYVTNSDGYKSGGDNPPGTYTISYKACDSSVTSGMTDMCSTATRDIEIVSVPVISMPAGNLVVNQGHPYDAETGVTCSDNGVSCTGDMYYTSTGGDGFYNGNGTDTPGTYTITYHYTNAQGYSANLMSRTIRVNAPPTITPPPPPSNMASYGDIVINQGDVINVVQMYQATDPENGNISSKIRITDNPNNFKGDGTDAVGEYPIVLCVEDNDTTAIPSAPKGFETCINQEIYVNSLPTIATPGNVVVNAGHPYDAMTGVNCSDLELGTSCTNNVTYTSSGGDGYYNGNGSDAPGTYTITYKYTDSNGAVATSSRTIRINAYPTITKPAPPTYMSSYGDIVVNEGVALDVKSKYSASDLEDGNLSSEIYITNNTNNFKGDGTDVPGSYPMTICVEDHDVTAIPSAPKGAKTCINQVVYVNDLPVITTNGDIIVNDGYPYDALTDVTCIDLETPDCTSGITYTSTGGDGAYNGDGSDNPGTYTITYHVTDANMYESTATSTIRVNAYPEIISPPPPTNMGSYGDIIVNEGDVHPILEGFTATDLEDGDITSNLYVFKNEYGYVGDGTDAPGAYPVTICAQDNETEAIPSAPEGAETCVDKKIYVNGKPTLTIPGDVVVNERYPLPAKTGVLCSDYEAPNGDCTGEVSYTSTGGDGFYDGDGTDAPGVYEITYYYSDANDFEATGSRTIRVNAYPTITEPEDPVHMPSYGDIVINAGETIDVKAQYEADDLEDGDLSYKIVVNSPDGFKGDGTDAPGAYDLEICVEDNETTAIPSAPNGAETCIDQVIYVNAQPTFETPPGDPIVIPENIPYDVLTGVTSDDLEDGDITYKIDADTAFIQDGGAKAGKTYDVFYSVEDVNEFENTTTKQIYVDANPVIEMPNGITFEEGEVIDLDELISGSDLEDPNFDDTLTIENKDGLKGDGTDPVGEYDITVCGIDSTGLTFCEDFVIVIVTNNKPVQQMPSTHEVTIFEGQTYNLEEEIVVVDHEDGEIDEVITENIKVDYPTLYFKGDGTDTEGRYFIEYEAIDSNDNILNGEVVINVVKPENGQALSVASESTVDLAQMNEAMFEANEIDATEINESVITNEAGNVINESALMSIDEGSYTITTEYVDANNEVATYEYEVVAEEVEETRQPVRNFISSICQTISNFVTNLF